MAPVHTSSKLTGYCQALLPSPASTCLPSPGPDPDATDGTSSESSYQGLDGGPVEASAESALGRFRRGRRFLPRIAATAAALAAVTALGYEAAQQTPPTTPRLWDPDLRVEFSTEPWAKSIIRRFDAYNMARGGRDDPADFRANVELYMAPDLLYESVGFGTWHTPAGWARGEEHNYGMAFPKTVFTQMLFFGDARVATTTTYGSAFWGGDLFGIKAPKQWVTLRITDMYLLREDRSGLARISYNFMMIDWVDVMRQVGRRMLPPSPLEEGTVLPPAVNDGVPAPLSVLVQAQNRNATASWLVCERALRHDWIAGEPGQDWHANMTFYGPGGIGLAPGVAAYKQHVLAPFRAAFTNRSAELALKSCEGNYCVAFGHLRGHGTSAWLGLPTAGRDVALRFVMHWRVVGGSAQESWAIFDFPGLFEQLGLDFYKLAAKRAPA